MNTTLPSVSMLPKMFFSLLFAGSMLFPQSMDAQTPCECTNCPQFMEDLFVGDFNLTVQNASNPTLGQNGQGVCGVIVHWDHTAICDISITLTSPSGQVVTLVGPIGQFCTSNGNAGTDWNVTFLPCNDPNVAPDPGFSANWNNNQNWGANNNYSGSYYPSSGCLQNFSGPVNGDWTLTVTDGQANDIGNLYNYEVIFCDPSGINCFTCEADAGNLPQPNFAACRGDQSLILNLPPTYLPPAQAPPPSEYSYTYIVSGSTGVIVAYDPVPDLTGLPAGNYTVCGLSYYTLNENLIPPPNGTLTLTQLSNQLNSNQPPFCGNIGFDCVGVTILPLPPNVAETGEVCAPECYFFNDVPFCTSGTYELILYDDDGCPYTGTLNLTVFQPDLVLLNEVICSGTCSQNPSFLDACTAGGHQVILTNTDGCDSIVFLNLIVINANAAILLPVPDLGCSQNSIVLQGAGSTIGPNTTYLWTATGGGNIVGANNTINATVDAPGNYQLLVCRSQGGVACCDSVGVTVTTSQTLPDVPVLSGNDTICPSQMEVFWLTPVASANSYTWSVPPNATITSGQTTDSITVLWNGTIGGAVCATANNACGTSAPACFNVFVDNIPAPVQPTGDTLLCAGDTVIYAVVAVPGANAWNWQVSGGTLLAGNGTDSLTVVWDGNVAAGSVCAVAAGLCGTSPSTCLNVVVNTPPLLPVMTGDTSLCAGTSGSYTIQPLNGATGYAWIAPPGGTIASGQNTTAITVDWTAAPGGNICVAATGLCGAGPQQCLPVNVLAQPVANAGIDSALCGTVLGLSATTSVFGSNGLWTVLPGAPGTVTFSASDSIQTDATVSTSGIYFFQWTEANGICADSDTVQGTFNASPQIGQIQSACDGANQNYTVTFPFSGGAPPYTITGGTLAGNIFTSDPIISAQSYAFTVVDGNGCNSITVIGSVNCNCSSDAGQMDLQQLSACPGSSVTAQQQGGVLDANDIGAFVLHSNAGNSLGTIFDQNTTGTFGFSASMVYGVTYYISFVVGDDLNGAPDLNDPCLSVAQGQPVVFYDNPVANAGTDNAGCTLTLPMNGAAVAGTVLWTVASAPAGGNVMIADPVSGATTVTVSQFGAYTFAYTVTVNGCSGSDNVVLNFNNFPDAGPVSFLCDGANLNYTVSFPIIGGLAPYSVNGLPVAGVNYVSPPYPTGSTYVFSISDANGCTSPSFSSIFNCNCFTNAGTMVITPITFCAGQPATAVWNNNATLDADDAVQFILHSNAGATLGTVFATNSQPEFNFVAPLQTGITYYISAIAGNSPAGTVDLADPCLNIAFGAPVQWRPLPTASLAGDTSYCAGGNATLVFSGTGLYPLQVTYLTAGGTPLAFTIPDAQTVALPVTPQLTTTYTLVSVSDGTAPVCTATLNDPATIIIVPDPVADAGQDQTIGCASTFVTLGGPATSTGAGILYEWTYQGAIVGTSKQLTAMSAGAYELLVTNAGGCTAVDAAAVVVDQTEPMAFVINVREITCYGDNDGSILLDSIVSAQPPVLFSLNGGPYGPSSQFFPLGPDTYVISLQDAAGCEWSTGSIVLSQPVEVLVDLGADVEITLGNDVTLNAQTNLPLDGLESVVWSPLLDILNAGTLTQQFTPTTSRIITLTVTDQNGCTDVDAVLVVVQRPNEVYIPNAIKPGTGINERLVVFGGASVAGIDYLRIYDRWGGQVYEDLDFIPNDFSRGWDGKANGKNASPGVYVYYAMVRYVDGTTELVFGDVTVMW